MVTLNCVGRYAAVHFPHHFDMSPGLFYKSETFLWKLQAFSGVGEFSTGHSFQVATNPLNKVPLLILCKG